VGSSQASSGEKRVEEVHAEYLSSYKGYMKEL
jgi:hypothetical protein